MQFEALILFCFPPLFYIEQTVQDVKIFWCYVPKACSAGAVLVLVLLCSVCFVCS